MGLMEKLLARSIPPGTAKRRVLARVLLDDAGHVQAVQLTRSCGDPSLDHQALQVLRNTRCPGTRLGSKTSRRWHDVAYTIE
ncbi:energy transducer TonB [Trinickia acidisoli]|uniref:energy transducer TonB n=1 Tax=Trinickia acidisoli TaxID=2767482 RepID=UPI001A8E4BA0|nr:TonB family protein [Trinickia acidisoli]